MMRKRLRAVDLSVLSLSRWMTIRFHELPARTQASASVDRPFRQSK